MSSLEQEVSERRAAKAAEFGCVSVQPGGLALLVCEWQRESWVLPWAQFIGARLSGKDANGLIQLTFANYLVTVTGENLRGLLNDLVMQRVTCLRDLPSGYRSQAKPGEPFITQIEVTAGQSGAVRPEGQP